MGSLVFQATLGGQVNLNGPNTASTFDIAVPATTGTMVTTGDTGTVTNTMLAGSIANAKLTNSSVTVGSTSIALGATSTTLDGVNIGATTAGTGAFTTLSASSTVSGTGFSTYLASPPAIGATTAAAGAFTTLSASSTVSGTGFSTYLASPPAIGGTAAAAGTFTTLSGTTSVTTPIVKSASSLTLQTNGTTTAVTVDASQNVGIGTTTPSGRLQVTATAGSQTDAYFGNQTAGARTNIRVQSASNSDGYVFFERSGASENGYIRYSQASDFMSFQTASAERMRIDSSGNVLIGQASVTGDGEKVSISNTTTSGSVYNTTLRLVSTTTGAGSEAKMMFSLGGASTGISYISSQLEGAGYGNLIFATRPNGGNVTERMRINSSGYLLVNQTSNTTSSYVQIYGAQPALSIESTSTGGVNQVLIRNPNGTVGSIGTSGSSTSFNTSSDYRLKENIAPMMGALAKVALLKPVTYKWKVDGSNGEGFIAHELAEVCPHAVTGAKDAVDEDGNPVYQGVDVSFLVATLTAAIQEQQALITSLTARIAALEAK